VNFLVNAIFPLFVVLGKKIKGRRKMTRKHVFWFWGAMDALYLIRYAVASVIQARISFLSDLESALWVLRDHSVV